MNDNDEKRPLTATEILLRKRRLPIGEPSSEHLQKKAIKTLRFTHVDIDDEIKCLEADLQASSSSDSVSCSSESDKSGHDSKGSNSSFKNKTANSSHDKIQSTPLNVLEKLDNQKEKDDSVPIICLSNSAKERIEALPNHLLPAKRRQKLMKGVDDDLIAQEKSKHKQITDLYASVKNVLAGYSQRSTKGRPFYCRHCDEQLDNQQDFVTHKSSDFHQLAVKLQLKASYCKPCRKQLTSPAQLEEHVTSRPHQATLQRIKQRQVQYHENSNNKLYKTVANDYNQNRMNGYNNKHNGKIQNNSSNT